MLFTSPRLLANSFRYLSLAFKLSLSAFLTLFLVSSSHANPAPSKDLQIYFVDVEGGQATLFVTPEGKSLLIDTGWPGNDGRDADRIVAAAKQAKVSKIDFVLLTHFHMDHAGGLTQLADRIPIGALIDHGDNTEHTDGPTEQVWKDYLTVVSKKNFKRLQPKVGDLLPITGMQARVVSSNGFVLPQPMLGSSQNPTCATSQQAPADKTENSHSLGILVTFGKLHILDLGDLTADKEWDLMCPSDKLGKVDIYIVSHHGWNQSGSAVLLNGIAPRVAIMDNGAKKGGSPSSWDIIEKSPRLQDLWQLHYSEEGGDAHNVPATFIANPQGPDSGNYLKLTAKPDGSFEVFNSRTQSVKNYPAAP
jgi:beta-lactamase superfamily II metal-dependent hydrolase